MAALSVEVPYIIYLDVDGQPIDDGYLYIGTSGLNPETNPINVYWDAALTIPAAQPIRTINGYPSRSGSPGRLYVDASDYSITIRNKNGTLVHTALTTLSKISFDQLSGQPPSSQVDFLQSGIGAVTRTVEDRLKDLISVKDFGAVGDGTDDTAEIQAAIDYAISVGKALYFPGGHYRCSAQLVVTTGVKQLVMLGDGHANTQLVWDDPSTDGGGISITYTDSVRPPRIEGMGLITNALATGTALKITGPDSVSEIQYGPIVRDIRIQGGDMGTDCWDIGIEFVTCWYPEIETVNINGLNEYGPTFNASVGIKLTGCQVCYFSKFNIWHVTTAVLEAASGGINHGEGFTFHNFEIVGVGTGISLAADLQAPGTNIGPGHINAFNYGLNLARQYQTCIHDLLIYKTEDLAGTPQSFIGINVNESRNCHIHDNFIHGFKAANLVGMQFSGAETLQNQIHDNAFYNFTASTGNKIGIVLGSNIDENIIHSNFLDSSVAIPYFVSGAGASNKFFNNIPKGVYGFGANDATPSVANDLYGFWQTANSAPTSITNFDDGYYGQEILILVNDANTTFVQGATLQLEGSVNWAPGNGAMITFIFTGTTWREISRRVP